MPPPHLHPRSRMTSSLFATTVLASFFVVVLPHVLPCPAPRVALADGQVASADGAPARRRRRRRTQEGEVAPGAAAAKGELATEVERGEDGMARFALVDTDKDNNGGDTTTSTAGLRRTARECPVPKPGGIVGELLGFRAKSSSEPDQQQNNSPAPAPLPAAVTQNKQPPLPR